MIRFHFSITNPWYKENNPDCITQKNLFYVDEKITKNKAFSAQITWFSFQTIFDIELDFRWRGRDHGGILFEFTILGLSAIFNWHDTRHWNYEECRWMTAEDHEKERLEWENY